jgi:hypothetical protein
MKKAIAFLFATTLCLLAGCASRGSDGNASSGSGSGSSSSSSGITVFGTVDAGVSNYKNQSR